MRLPGLLLVPGLAQIKRQVKEKKKNESAEVVWLIVEAW